MRILRRIRELIRPLVDCTCRPNVYVECRMERLGGQGDCFTCWRLYREDVTP